VTAPPGNAEHRPAGAVFETTDSAGGRSDPILREVPAVVDGAEARVVLDTQPVDLLTLGRRDLTLWEAGYMEGYCAGVPRGREQADEEAAQLHRQATRIVHAMAKLDPHVDRERRRRQRQVEAAERHTANAQPWPAEAVRAHGVRLLDERGVSP